MGRDKWITNDSNAAKPYVVVLMVSRNKDNRDVPNFKERRKSKFITLNEEKINEEFADFASHGVPGEMSRLYISLNARDPKKVRKQFLHTLIDNEDIKFDYIEATLAGIAAEKQNALEKKWFFDFDSDNAYYMATFLGDLSAFDNDDTLKPECVKTPNGYAIIVQHGFDTRALLSIDTWSNLITLKRDDLICRKWIRKEINE